MNTEFFNALEALEKERGIPKEYMMEKVEAALVSAFKRDNGGRANVRVVFNPEKKDVKVYSLKEVVETVEDPETQISLEDAKKIAKKYQIGDFCEFEVKTKSFGRISAQTARQVIVQGIREAERSMLIKEYESKKEEVVTATVVKVDPVNGNAIVDTGTSEATLLKSEQIPGESYEVGDHIKVFVMEVKNEVKGPIVTLSRTHFGLVKRLFELEVPEIQDGVVEIMSIAREAGSRTKIAVYAEDPNVDPVGACVGPRGSRVQAVVDEIFGEKIDIIEWDSDPAVYIAKALSPAKVIMVYINETEKAAKVVVPDQQLSLAIGKEGQNARLAAKLTGWKIDIKSQSQAEEELDRIDRDGMDAGEEPEA